jgi:hypothetical protein
MSNERTNSGNGAAADEPALTQKNSQTVTGETTLADQTSTRTETGAIPSSYGAAGGTTDATEEGGDGTGI